LENVIEVDEDKEKEEPPKEEAKVDVVHVNKATSQGGENSHLVEGPHHSLVIKPDVIPSHSESHKTTHKHHHHHEEDPEEEVKYMVNTLGVATLRRVDS